MMDRREAIEWLKSIRRTSVFEQVEALDLAIEALQESINKVRQADTLIIAAALRDFAQDNERNISDRERAEELREQVLAYGASMCYDTPTERIGEWKRHPIHDNRAWDVCTACGIGCRRRHYGFNEDGTEWVEEVNYPFCPNCGAKMGGDTE